MEELQTFFSFLRWQDIVDILVISFVFYKLFLLLADTRAMQLVKGLLMLGCAAAIANFFQLQALLWLFSKLFSVVFITIPIIFYPELRRMLEELGRGTLLQRVREREHADKLAEEVTRALLYLQSRRIGALLVLQRRTGLKDVWRPAVKLQSHITQELLISIFWPDNPLHDGAVILDREQIIAAACYLPLTEKSLARWYGTRHRAALGITENSDAISLVVSEERGEITLAVNGVLSRGLKDRQVRRLLLHYFQGKVEEQGTFERLRDEFRNVWRGGNDDENA
ncbi:MAG: diadenylate cyclase CdaA [Synergistales bacterium]|nr:diadenylate cyclase CdaA [Synergistales bacterium]